MNIYVPLFSETKQRERTAVIEGCLASLGSLTLPTVSFRDIDFESIYMA